MNEPHTGNKMLELLQKHEGQAFTITQLSQNLGVSRVSTRKHAKKLSKDTSNGQTEDTEHAHVRMAKGPGKQTGTGVVIWFGKAKYASILNEGASLSENKPIASKDD
jgi:hypothetical protein